MLVHFHRIFLQALKPLHRTPHQESPTAPKRAQARLIHSPSLRTIAKRRAQGEADAAHQIPQANMPAQRAERGRIPIRLRLEHEQEAGRHEAQAAQHLRGPVRARERAWGQHVVDARQRGEARDPEHARGQQLDQRRQEAELVQVVRAQVRGRGPPCPGAGGAGVGGGVGGGDDAVVAGGGEVVGGDVGGWGFADEVAFVGVVVDAAGYVWTDADGSVFACSCRFGLFGWSGSGFAVLLVVCLSLFGFLSLFRSLVFFAGVAAAIAVAIPGIFNSPSKASFPSSVHGLEKEEDTADFEDRSANERCDTTAVESFTRECGAGLDKREECKETIDDPDDRSPGEDVRNIKRDVPDRIVYDHQPNITRYRLERIGRWGGPRDQI